MSAVQAKLKTDTVLNGLWVSMALVGVGLQLVGIVFDHRHHHDPQGFWGWARVLALGLEAFGFAVMAWANLDARAKAQRAAAKP
jgi:hypothetical protein